MTSLYPLLLEASLHAKPWGGRTLESVLGKTLPTSEPYGEAWELHDTARVINGPLAGRTVGEVLREYGAALVGPGVDPAEGMPLLAKFLDAQEWLSIQNHPDDEEARQLEGEPRGKTEAWYVVSAEPGARLVIGIQPGYTREQVAEAIRTNTLEQLIAYAEVRAGDVLYNAAGMIHALGPGMLVYEIQQSSDTTYRLYDWGRMGLDGKPRTLHIDKGLQVAKLGSLIEVQHTGDDPALKIDIVRSAYFDTVLYQLNEGNGREVALETGGTSYHSLTCIDGQAEVRAGGEAVSFGIGQTVLVPASVGAYTLNAAGARVLLSKPPAAE